MAIPSRDGSDRMGRSAVERLLTIRGSHYGIFVPLSDTLERGIHSGVKEPVKVSDHIGIAMICAVVVDRQRMVSLDEGLQ